MGRNEPDIPITFGPGVDASLNDSLQKAFQQASAEQQGGLPQITNLVVQPSLPEGQASVLSEGTLSLSWATIQSITENVGDCNVVASAAAVMAGAFYNFAREQGPVRPKARKGSSRRRPTGQSGWGVPTHFLDPEVSQW
jgi:hypothetical protein